MFFEIEEKQKVGPFSKIEVTKGQIKPKADWRATDSPKKRRNKFVFFHDSPEILETIKKNRSFVFWENLKRANLLLVLSDL